MWFNPLRCHWGVKAKGDIGCEGSVRKETKWMTSSPVLANIWGLAVYWQPQTHSVLPRFPAGRKLFMVVACAGGMGSVMIFMDDMAWPPGGVVVYKICLYSLPGPPLFSAMPRHVSFQRHCSQFGCKLRGT